MKNYKIKDIPDSGKVVLCRETFCPMKTFGLEIQVLAEAQHDGHGWTEEDVKRCESRLIEEIMEDLKVKVESFVRKTKPYDCHVFD